MTALAQLGEQLARALERLHLADQLAVEAPLGLADRVAAAPSTAAPATAADELVAAHADVAVDPPDRRRQVVLAKRPVPRDRVLVVGVDEGPVDVEDRRGRPRADPTT